MVKWRVWADGISGDQVLVNLSEQRELVVLALLGSRLLRAESKALIALLVSLDGARVPSTSTLDQDDMSNRVVIKQFLAVARAARNATLQSDGDPLLLLLLIFVLY